MVYFKGNDLFGGDTISPRILVETVTGFFLENLDKSGQVGLAGKGRVKEVGSFDQGTPLMSGVIQQGLVPRNKITWRSKMLEARRPEKESIAIVQVGSEATSNLVTSGNRKEEKLLRNEACLLSIMRAPSLSCSALTSAFPGRCSIYRSFVTL